MVSVSIGSMVLPFASFCVMTSGLETQNSIPSRRISSIKMPVQLAATGYFNSVRSADIFHAQSRIDTRFPFKPCFYLAKRDGVSVITQKGLVFTRKNIETVGSSISSGGSTVSGVETSEMVSPRVTPSAPENQTISPAMASSTSTRSSPLRYKYMGDRFLSLRYFSQFC